MGSSTPVSSNLSALFKDTSAAGNATLVRCPPQTLTRLQRLHEAEFVALFTPVVPPHPDSVLEKTDPFEPLGRSLKRKVRHVPYRLDHGLTTTHESFLPTCGAIIVVICSPENVLEHNANAFQPQFNFARDVGCKVVEDPALVDVPLILLLISNSSTAQIHLDNVRDFPAVVTLEDYSTAALSNAVGVIFGH